MKNIQLLILYKNKFKTYEAIYFIRKNCMNQNYFINMKLKDIQSMHLLVINRNTNNNLVNILYGFPWMNISFSLTHIISKNGHALNP